MIDECGVAPVELEVQKLHVPVPANVLEELLAARPSPERLSFERSLLRIFTDPEWRPLPVVSEPVRVSWVGRVRKRVSAVRWALRGAYDDEDEWGQEA